MYDCDENTPIVIGFAQRSGVRYASIESITNTEYEDIEKDEPLTIILYEGKAGYKIGQVVDEYGGDE